MTIYRFPVPDHPNRMPPNLPCIDFVDGISSPRKSTVCRAEYLATKKHKFRCPNLKNKVKGYCWLSSFLYPRGWRDAKGGSPAFLHFHQGIDIAGSEFGARVVSVTGGEVMFMTDTKYRRGCGGYGRMVVVYDGRSRQHFLYAHLKKGVLVRKGDIVLPGQVIGYVGNSATSDGEIIDYDSSGAHLHFEVSEDPYPKKRGKETTLGDWPDDPYRPRLDPIAALERLGPYMSLEVYDPRGDQILAEGVEKVHQLIETSPAGGYFPLGANNVWHGGVHLPVPLRSIIVAPFDAEVVAFRLDPNPPKTPNKEAFGSTNFILLRHEIPPEAFVKFRSDKGKDAPPATSEKKLRDGVGKNGSNPTEWVIHVKHKLADAGVFAGDTSDGTSDAALIEAIKAFQKSKGAELGWSWKPDGFVKMHGTTWKALHGGADEEPPEVAPREEASDSTRTIYSLVMHLDRVAVDAKAAKDAPWLTRVELGPAGPVPPPVPPEIKDEDENEIAGHPALTADVGPKQTNAVVDVEWVKKRLNRLQAREGARRLAVDGEVTESFVEAIKTFQADHVQYYKRHAPDGIVNAGKNTETALRITAEQYARGGGSTEPAVDPELLARIQELDADDVAKVIVPEHGVKVSGGDALWYSGQATGFTEDGASGLLDQIHWEIFSEHEQIASWPDTLEDANDDLTVDVPELIEKVDDTRFFVFKGDGILYRDEIQAFYNRGDAKFLRQTKCKFRSEWAMDLAAAIPKLEEKKFAHAKTLGPKIQPYLWWDQAASVLPKIPHVWHYNPIEFLGFYSEVLETLVASAADSPTETPDLDKVAWLTVVVLNKHRGPSEADLPVYATIEDPDWPSWAVPTDAGGVAQFGFVPIGPCTITIPLGGVSQSVTVEGGVSNEVVVVTTLDGDPPPTGVLTVATQKHRPLYSDLSGVPVVIVDTITGKTLREVVSGTGKREDKPKRDNAAGDATFELPQGRYTVRVGPAVVDGYRFSEQVEEVTLEAKTRLGIQANTNGGVLEVHTLHDGAPAPNTAIDVLAGKTQVAYGESDASGTAEFELAKGKYTVVAGSGKKRHLHVGINRRKLVEVDVGHEPEPEPETPAVVGTEWVTVRVTGISVNQTAQAVSGLKWSLTARLHASTGDSTSLGAFSEQPVQVDDLLPADWSGTVEAQVDGTIVLVVEGNEIGDETETLESVESEWSRDDSGERWNEGSHSESTEHYTIYYTVSVKDAAP